MRLIFLLILGVFFSTKIKQKRYRTFSTMAPEGFVPQNIKQSENKQKIKKHYE